MMIDCPAFNYDNSGNPIVPAEAPVEHNALVKAIEAAMVLHICGRCPG